MQIKGLNFKALAVRLLVAILLMVFTLLVLLIILFEANGGAQRNKFLPRHSLDQATLALAASNHEIYKSNTEALRKLTYVDPTTERQDHKTGFKINAIYEQQLHEAAEKFYHFTNTLIEKNNSNIRISGSDIYTSRRRDYFTASPKISLVLAERAQLYLRNFVELLEDKQISPDSRLKLHYLKRLSAIPEMDFHAKFFSKKYMYTMHAELVVLQAQVLELERDFLEIKKAAQ